MYTLNHLSFVQPETGSGSSSGDTQTAGQGVTEGIVLDVSARHAQKKARQLDAKARRGDKRSKAEDTPAEDTDTVLVQKKPARKRPRQVCNVPFSLLVMLYIVPNRHQGHSCTGDYMFSNHACSTRLYQVHSHTCFSGDSNGDKCCKVCR